MREASVSTTSADTHADAQVIKQWVELTRNKEWLTALLVLVWLYSKTELRELVRIYS